jgi:hypothetical protein
MSLTIQQILQDYGQAYAMKHPLSFQQVKVMQHLCDCRTDACGTHHDVCDHCGYEHVLYNSCKDRHCPQCQVFKKETWINQRKAEVIETPYFHVVLTLPKDLHVIAMQNQRLLYGLLFKAAGAAMKALTADKKYLGANPGFLSVLHTWGQTLDYHPHLHLIVTGGGLTETNQWRTSKKHFFIPVKKLSATFRYHFLTALKQAYADQLLQFYGSMLPYEEPFAFQSLIDRLYQISWYSYVKQPFDGPHAVIEYLGRYTHRIAISNHRCVKVENGKVYFKWKDYKDGSKQKVMALDIDEFIRRFLLHVLPSGFMKMRYYGIMANRNKKTKLVQSQRLTTTLNHPIYRVLSKVELLMKVTNGKAFQCPKCKQHTLKRLGPWQLQPNRS